MDSNNPTPHPTPVPIYDDYDNRNFDLFINLIVMSIVCYCILKNIIRYIRERRELARIREMSGVFYDVELARYDFSGCFDEKIYPNLTIEQTKCVICFEDYEENENVCELKKCKHCFHKHCINQWLNEKSVCPICREEVMIIT